MNSQPRIDSEKSQPAPATDGSAAVPPAEILQPVEISSASRSDLPLRRDVRMLGFELGRILKRHGSEGLFDLVEEIRALSKARRTGDAGAEAALRDKVRSLAPRQIEELIRALACFFDLANLAEDRHRIRVLRERERALHPAPRRESVGAAIETLRERGLDAQGVQSLLNQLAIELVFTAHPTEAKRRTIRNTLRRLRQDLIDLDSSDLLPRERDSLLAQIKTDLACLWETDSLRPRRPTVLEEVRRSLFVAESVWDVVPRLFRSVRHALGRAYPGHSFDVPAFLEFGSWIGGDRDGNPFVTADVTRTTLAILRKAALRKHVQQCDRLLSILTISREQHPVSEKLIEALDAARAQWPWVGELLADVNPHEIYRHWLMVIRARLERTAAADPFVETPDAAYSHPRELRRDLSLITHSLRENDHEDLAEGDLQDWLDRTAVFGFHLARLDVREDAARLLTTVAELMKQMGLASDYAALDEDAKQALLTRPLTAADTDRLREEELSEPTRETYRLFVLLHQTLTTLGRDALGAFVISMTRQPSDALGVLWLSGLASSLRDGGRAPRPLPIAPLFETIDDLSRADAILTGLLSQPTYAEHVGAGGGLQICMVGYSDSTKDGGNLAANWGLYQAERRLAQVARQHNVELMLFHGRGGALGRGGGPAARGILSLPPQSVRGKLRMTEQGEVLAERYDDPEIAYRHLEQVSWATLLVSANADEEPDPLWTRTLDRASAVAMRRYRELITDPGFVAYFDQATPIASIETLPIGSRPSRRRGQRRLEDLRAIPYTFAWTQSRHMITAFFGLGTGLLEASGGDWAVIRDMYERWPFFQAVIDNAELALAKADMSIAREYAALVADQSVGQRIWGTIDEEYARSREAVLAITGHSELLSATPWLQRSIRVRNPYIDPLNFIQGDLMHRLRAGQPKGDAAPTEISETLNQLLRLSVQGISAGMRTTG